MGELHPISRSVGIPQKIGRYRVLCELGTGSMASLYLGRAGGLGGFERLFALKVVHPHLCRKPAFIDMFLNEARIAASVHHPNVVPVYEIDVDDGQYYLAMDYVSGETLALLLRFTWNAQRALPMRIAAHIVASAAEGLHAAHELTDADGGSRNVVHRDVAPQNIMIGYDGIVRVTDFGIAKAMDSVSQTKPGVLKGTVAYMSPEQVRGKELDRRVDVFALGVLLWEATLGLRLFKDSTDLRTAGRILRMSPPPPTSMHDDYPEALERIVMKALAKDRDERYPTARALSEDLFAYLATEERVTASDMEAFLGDVFAKRLEQRRALERDAANPEPPQDLGDHLSEASQTLGLEHFTAQQAWGEFDPDELEAEGLNEIGAALRERAAIRPTTLPRETVEKNHATTSKMPRPRFDSGPEEVPSPKSILPSGRVSVEVAPKPEAKQSILPPLNRKDTTLDDAAIGSAIEAALEDAPADIAADAQTLDEGATDEAAKFDASAIVEAAEALPEAQPEAALAEPSRHEATPAELVFRDTAPVPKFSQREVATALIRDTGPIPLVQPDVIDVVPEDTKRVENPLPPEPEAPLEVDEAEVEEGLPPAEPDAPIAAEEQNARRTRFVAIAVAAVFLLVTVFALWSSGSEPEPVAVASEVEAIEEPEPAPEPEPEPEPELVAPKPMAAPEPPATVSIQVEAKPARAEVLVDGRPYTGPVEVKRSAADQHVVRVQAPGHRPKMIVVDADEDRVVQVELEPDAIEKKRKRRRRRRRVTPKPAKKRARTKTGAILFDGDDL